MWLSQQPCTPEYTHRGAASDATKHTSHYFATRLGSMEAQVHEMSTQVTNNASVINEVLLAQQTIKHLLTSLLPSLHAPAPSSFAAPSESPVPVGIDRRLFSTHNGIAVAGLVQPPSPRDHQSHLPSPPSWMTADTILVTATDEDVMEAGTECTKSSGGVSETELNVGDEHTHGQAEPQTPCTDSAQTTCLTTSPVVDSRVSTRSRACPTDPSIVQKMTEGAERSKCAPKEKAEAIACMRACWILHPDAGDDIVAEGRAGGSWKCPTQKFGHLCGFGDQMVQVHRVFYSNHRLLHMEERNPNFSTLKDAVVKPKYSNVYIKWDSRFIIAKPTKKSAPT